MSFQFSLTILDSLYLIISLSSSSVSFYQLNLSNICPKLLEITINKQFAETQIRAAGEPFSCISNQIFTKVKSHAYTESKGNYRISSTKYHVNPNFNMEFLTENNFSWLLLNCNSIKLKLKLCKNLICNLRFAPLTFFHQCDAGVGCSHIVSNCAPVVSKVMFLYLVYDQSTPRPTVQYAIFIWFKTLIRSVRVIARERLINWTVPHRSSMLSLNDGVGWLQRLQRRPIKCPGKRLGSWQRLGFTNDMNRLPGATVKREKYLHLKPRKNINLTWTALPVWQWSLVVLSVSPDLSGW